MKTSINSLNALVTDELLKSVVSDETQRNALTNREKLQIAIYSEIANALNAKYESHIAILQCNYRFAKSATAHLYDLIRFVSRDNEQRALTNLYVTIRNNTVYVKVYATADKLVQDDLSKLDFDIKKHFKQVKLSELTSTVASLHAVLKNHNML